MVQPKHKKWLFIVAAALIVPSLAFAQGFQTGAISAIVKDQTGATLPGVTVTVTSDERGTQRTGVTDTTGTAKFAVLPVGFYKIEAALSGFNNAVREHNKVDAEKTTEVPLTLALASTSETITVSGQQPVVDRTNVAANTQISTKEFERTPVGRGYQSLIVLAPGVIDQPGNPNSGNPQVHGAVNTSNVYLFDGVDSTDPTNGRFGANMNFEAIQEVSVQTAGMSAEYGRATGAVLNVITKSGTNKFEGSLKSIQTNDAWNAQNDTHNEVTGAPLARERVDHNVYRYAATLGGPIWRDHVWFFGAYEKTTNTGAAQTTTVSGEEYTQTLDVKLPNYRLSAQITPTQNIWAKYDSDPINGFITDYWGASPELYSLTSQDQGGNRKTAQYSGIFGQSFTVEALYGKNTGTITVFPYKLSPLTNGAPHYNEADQKYYNGATFDGFVDRPREQFVAAGSYFTTLGGNSHNFKAGVDWQSVKSTSSFKFPNSQLYDDLTFDYVNRTFEPFARLDYVDAPSTSNGKITALYARDKFDVSRRLFMELGLRVEKETSKSDVGEKILDTTGWAPRVQASYDLLGTGNTILNGTLGRFYSSVVQNFADQFANVPQQTNYDLYLWNGSAYEFAQSVRAGANATQPNLGLHASYVDEVTLGAQQQLGPTVGVGARLLYRKWGNLIDDVLSFDANGQLQTTFENLPEAKRNYKGVELTFEKRFAHNWNLLANYTYSQTRGNHFGTIATPLGNFVNQNCRTVTDPSVGTIPCQQANLTNDGRPTWDIPHLFNLLGSYAFNLGPVALTAGAAGLFTSGNSYSKTRSLTVLDDAGNPVSGQAVTYYYEGQGSDRGPNWWKIDGSLEATYRILGVDVGAKGEVFNVFNKQTPVVVSNTAWCGTTSTPACQTAVNRYGTYTSRGSFMTPRSFRLTALVRF